MKSMGRLPDYVLAANERDPDAPPTPYMEFLLSLSEEYQEHRNARMGMEVGDECIIVTSTKHHGLIAKRATITRATARFLSAKSDGNTWSTCFHRVNGRAIQKHRSKLAEPALYGAIGGALAYVESQEQES